MKSKRKVPLDLFDRALEAVATLGFIGMLVTAWSQILFRYVLEIPVPWTEQLARVLFVLSMFLGIAVAIRRGEHIVVSFVLMRIPVRPRYVVEVIYDLTILGFLVILAIGCWGMTRMTWDSPIITIGWLRTGELFLFEMGAVAVMMLYVVLRVAGHLRDLRRPGTDADASEESTT